MRGGGDPGGWRAAAVALGERGRLAWALGAALEQALGGAAALGGSEVAALEGIVAQALRQVTASDHTQQRPVAQSRRSQGAAADRAAATTDAAAVWRQMQGTDLGGKPAVVVWIASGGSGGDRATLALGVAADGQKQVLGVWAGGTAEHRCSQQLTADLRSRGLGRGTAFVAVTTGERALELALRQQWPQRVVLAHCQEQVAEVVAGHLPAGMREQARLAMQAAWEMADAGGARRGLGDLATGWQHSHPGAAARLRVEIEPTTTTQVLGVCGPLAKRLRTAAPARYLLQRCRSEARGRSGHRWVAAIAMAARQRQDGFRRLPGHAALAQLAHTLAEREAATAAN